MTKLSITVDFGNSKNTDIKLDICNILNPLSEIVSVDSVIHDTSRENYLELCRMLLSEGVQDYNIPSFAPVRIITHPEGRSGL